MKPVEYLLGVPAFLTKLRKMVDDPETDNLICWSKDGKSFIIRNEVNFWYTLLPVYYKHNNMSSFVRQLNMYGFHKISNYDSNTSENDKTEYQFLHPYFQKDGPDLMKKIKRKVTNSTRAISSSDDVVKGIENNEQLNKILSEVEYLHNRQTHMDTVLNNLKQENSVLWRELALLRQKYQKQQQIVNKLIQFLVTIVQPSARMGGLSLKRRYSLMINGASTKKQKTSSDGPTIHELDSTDPLSEEGFADSDLDIAQVESPTSSQQNQCQSPSSLLDEVENIKIEPNILLTTQNLETNKQINDVVMDALLSNSDLSEETSNLSYSAVNDNFVEEMVEPIAETIEPTAETIETTAETIEPTVEIIVEPTVEIIVEPTAETIVEPTTETIVEPTAEQTVEDDYETIFINPNSQDKILTNLIHKSCNVTTEKLDNEKLKKDEQLVSTPNMTVATRDQNLSLNRLNSYENIDNYIGVTQSELDQLKEYLSNCNTIDSSYILNLFNEIPSYGISSGLDKNEPPENDLHVGSELAPYESNEIVDFSELFDDSVDASEFFNNEKFLNTSDNNNVNTPDISDLQPAFPSNSKIS